MALRPLREARRASTGRLALAATAVAIMVAVASLSGAQAATDPHRGGLPPRKGGSDSAVFLNGSNTVVRAKTKITLTPLVLRAYANEKFTIHKPFLFTTSLAWAVSNPGRHPVFGVFPVTHTATLNFGALPVTADLHLTQPIVDGKIVPLIIKTRGLLTSSKKFPVHVTGLIDIRLSNVRVDEVPLNLGPNCHTVTPMKLHLVGSPRNYSLFTGGPLHGVVTIPPFTGCGTNGDDLDPLITGTLSGPGNPLVQRQGNLGKWDPSKPNDCGDCRPPKR